MSNEKVEKKEEVKETKIDEKGTLDKFIETGESPEKVEDALKTEMDNANKTAKKEVEAIEKGEDPGKVTKEEKIKEKDKDKKKEEPAEELITEEYRKKYNVPDNIKTAKALVEWGRNAQKNMEKVLAERDKLNLTYTESEKRLAAIEAKLNQFTENLKTKVEDGKITEEQRAVEEEKMRILSETNPAEFARVIKQQIKDEAIAEEKRREAENNKSEYDTKVSAIRAKQKEELDALKKEYADKGESEKFENEIWPAIKKIAAERPYLVKFEEAMIIYKHNLALNEEKIKADEEAKLKEKKGDNSEVSFKSVTDDKQDKDAIAAAIEAVSENSSIEELDRAAGIKK
jgi:hypothetical protein